MEVGSYIIDVQVAGLSVPDSPLIAKAYDAGLIKVTDITDGVVGDLSTFRGESRTPFTRLSLCLSICLFVRVLLDSEKILYCECKYS